MNWVASREIYEPLHSTTLLPFYEALVAILTKSEPTPALFSTRHMCVQLRSLSHARLLKDYHLYRAKIFTLSLPNTLRLNPVV